MSLCVGEPDICFYIDDDLVATLHLDGVQNNFPWYEGVLQTAKGTERWRVFIDRYREADLELDYCPYHPDEMPYGDSELARYIAALEQLRTDPDRRHDEVVEAWREPWRDAPREELEQYLRFLDWRRWRAVNREGAVVDSIALPPKLDLQSLRFGFHM